jgi:para-nitrobenzyl esterase
MPFLANFSSACVQVKSRWGRTDLVYTEDCLRLNIWAQTKNLETADKLRPVLVFIHGGSHAYGAGLEHYFSPDAYVLEEDVIMVSINYRLGALGLLYHPTFDAANLPIFDQRLALQWIKAHIKDFGGDPDSIAVMGTTSSNRLSGLMKSPDA